MVCHHSKTTTHQVAVELFDRKDDRQSLLLSSGICLFYWSEFSGRIRGRMQYPAFSSLQERSAKAHITSVCVNEILSTRIWLSQNRVGSHCLLQRFPCESMFCRPLDAFCGLGQLGQWGCQGRKSTNEFAIEACCSEEASYLFT